MADTVWYSRRSVEVQTSRRVSLETIRAKRSSVELQMQNVLSGEYDFLDFQKEGIQQPQYSVPRYSISRNGSLANLRISEENQRVQQVSPTRPFTEEVSLIPSVRDYLPRYISHLPSDDAVLMCLRGRKYSVSRAAGSVIAYELWKRSNFVNNISTQEVKSTLKKYRLVAPGCTDRQGRPVVFFLGAPEADAPPSLDCLERAVIFLICQLLKTVDTQVHGILIVHNMEGLAPSRTTHAYRRAYLKRLHALTRDLPIKFGGLLLYNIPRFWSRCLSLLWPLMKQKLKSRVAMLGSGNLEQIKQLIDPAQLPVELGGNLVIDIDAWATRFCSLRGGKVAL